MDFAPKTFLSSVRLLRREIRKWMYYVLLAIRQTIQQVGSEKPLFLKHFLDMSSKHGTSK